SPGIPSHGMPPSVRVAMAERRMSPDSHLRSCRELTRYHVRTADGESCDLDDFLIDPETWRIANLVLDTGSWLATRQVICPPLFVETIDWSSRTIELGLTRSVLDDSTPFDPDVFCEDYERRVVKYYFDHMGET